MTRASTSLFETMTASARRSNVRRSLGTNKAEGAMGKAVQRLDFGAMCADHMLHAFQPL